MKLDVAPENNCYHHMFTSTGVLASPRVRDCGLGLGPVLRPKAESQDSGPRSNPPTFWAVCPSGFPRGALQRFHSAAIFSNAPMPPVLPHGRPPRRRPPGLRERSQIRRARRRARYLHRRAIMHLSDWRRHFRFVSTYVSVRAFSAFYGLVTELHSATASLRRLTRERSVNSNLEAIARWENDRRLMITRIILLETQMEDTLPGYCADHDYGRSPKEWTGASGDNLSCQRFQ